MLELGANGAFDANDALVYSVSRGLTSNAGDVAAISGILVNSRRPDGRKASRSDSNCLDSRNRAPCSSGSYEVSIKPRSGFVLVGRPPTN